MRPKGTHAIISIETNFNVRETQRIKPIPAVSACMSNQTPPERIAELEDRIEHLEATIRKMLPGRRDAMKLGGAAVIGAAAMSGTASAGSSQVGTIGDASNRVDLNSEDIDNSDTITTQDLVVNGTATGPFGGGGIVFEEGDSITVHDGTQVSVAGAAFEPVFDLGSGVDVYGGVIFGDFCRALRVTFGTNTTTTLIDGNYGQDEGNDLFTVLPVFPMKNVKKLEFQNGRGFSRGFGYAVLTT